MTGAASARPSSPVMICDTDALAGTPDFVVPAGTSSGPGPSGGRPARLFERGTASLLHPPILRSPGR